MKNLLLPLLLLLSFVSCFDDNKIVDGVKIVNNSDDDIVIPYGRRSFYKHIGGFVRDRMTIREYRDLIRDLCIHAHSNRYLDFLKDIITDSHEVDTLYLGVFNKEDCDTLTVDDFNTKYPIKYEFKVTLQYMIDHDWALVYPPED